MSDRKKKQPDDVERLLGAGAAILAGLFVKSTSGSSISNWNSGVSGMAISAG